MAALRAPIAPGERPSLMTALRAAIKPARDGLDPCGVSRSPGALFQYDKSDNDHIWGIRAGECHHSSSSLYI